MRILSLWAVLCLLGVANAGTLPPETARHLQRGHELFEYGRWSDARHEFRIVSETLSPADYAARQEVDYYLAACAVELGNPEAVDALLAFERAYPASIYRNDVQFALGSYYCAHGNLAEAQKWFAGVDRGALSASRREQYDFRSGYIAFQEGDYAAMYDHFGRIPASSDVADHVRYYSAYVDYAEGRYGQARQGFEELLRSAAYRDVAPYYLLQIAYHEGNYRYVVENGEELARKATPERQAEIERVMAESWFRLENYNAAIEHLNASFAAGGEKTRDACYLMGFSLYRTARYGEAAEWLRRACGGTEDAMTQNASYHLADCYLRAGDRTAALQAFGVAAATDGRGEGYDPAIAEDALFNYAKLQYEASSANYTPAILSLQRYIERYPQPSARLTEARTLLIAAYYNSRDYDAAYRAIRSMPSKDGETQAALQKIAYFRGLEAYQTGDRAAAKRYLAESVATNVSPKYTALANFWQGEIAFGEGDYATAATKYDNYLRRAPKSEPEYALALYNAGYCSFSQEQFDAAESSFQQFLKLRSYQDSYRSDTYNRLGDIRYAQRRFSEAIGLYDQAAATGDGSKYYARYQRAMTLGFLDQEAQKQTELQRIVAAGEGPYVEAAQFESGRSYLSSGRYAEGARTLEAFLQRYPNSVHRSQALSGLGLAYFNLGDRDKALAYYDQIVSAAPQSAEARNAVENIREIYLSRGDADAYFDYAERAGVESDLSAMARDSISFVAAQQLYLSERYERAAESLRSYLTSYPKGFHRRDALYLLSDCLLRNQERSAAIESLTELAAEENNSYTLRVLQKLSELTYAEKRYPEAAVAYRKLYDATSDAAERENAMTGYVRSTVAAGDEAAIRTMAAEVRAAADAGATARREATFALAESLRKAGSRSEAAGYYNELAGEVRTAEGSAAAYYLLEDRFDAGDLKAAEEAIFAYSERNPKSYWLGKAYLLLGEVYRRQGDDFQARATWQSIVNGYSPADDGIVDEANARIRKLN